MRALISFASIAAPAPTKRSAPLAGCAMASSACARWDGGESLPAASRAEPGTLSRCWTPPGLPMRLSRFHPQPMASAAACSCRVRQTNCGASSMAWPLGATSRSLSCNSRATSISAIPTAAASLIQRLRPRLSRLLIIDRPAGFSGHGAGEDPRFAQLYGPALLELAEPSGSFRVSLRGVAS